MMLSLRAESMPDSLSSRQNQASLYYISVSFSFGLIIGLAKISLGFFCNILRENQNDLFGQPQYLT